MKFMKIYPISSDIWNKSERIEGNWHSFFICLLDKNNFQKQAPRGVLKKRFSENMHPCRSATSIKLLCNFIDIALRYGCSPVNLLHIFRTPFLKSTSGLLNFLPPHEILYFTKRHAQLIFMWFLKFPFFLTVYVLFWLKLCLLLLLTLI